ncbi:MAG: histidine kinase dimerization/phosphoacceptor domain -containing protein [Balneolales bacterium]
MLNSSSIKSIFKASPSPQIILLPDEPQFTIVLVNEAFLQATNSVEEDLVGKPLFEAFPANPYDPEGDSGVKYLKLALEQLMIRKEPQKLEIQKYDIPVKGADKFEPKYWLPHHHPILNKNGGIDYILHSTMDVTEMVLADQKNKKTAKQLRKGKDQLKLSQGNLKYQVSLLNQIGEAVLSTDLNGLITYWNLAAQELYGWTAEEVIGRNVVDITPSEQTKKQADELLQVMQEGNSWAGEFMVKHKDGKVFPAWVSSSPILDTQGNHIGIVGISSDLSRRKQDEKVIKDSLHEKNILLNEIHHRVKNNLAIVSSLLTLQASSVTDKKLKVILKESEGRIHAMALIHELLYKHDDFSRIDFGAYIKKLLLHISEYYEATSALIKTQVQSVPIFLEISTAIPCGLITHEILTNIFKHAFPRGKQGEIIVTLKHVDDTVTMVISDNGIGLPKITKGTTLGLMLIEGLVKQIKGTLISETKNGTTYTITFPVLGLPKPGSNGNTPQRSRLGI